jgi:glycosyltransferase involved in cell wall biosynthesis
LVEENQIGFACESNSVSDFVGCLEKIKEADRDAMGEKARELCSSLFSVEDCFNKIINA